MTAAEVAVEGEGKGVVYGRVVEEAASEEGIRAVFKVVAEGASAEVGATVEKLEAAERGFYAEGARDLADGAVEGHCDEESPIGKGVETDGEVAEA